MDDTRHVPPTPPPSGYFIPKIKILHFDILYALSGLDFWKAYGPDGIPPIVLKNCASDLAPCLAVSLFLPILLAGSLFTFNLSSKRVTAPITALLLPNYRHVPFGSGLYKGFEFVLNKKIMRYLSANNFLFDCQNGIYRKGRSTGDRLAFLTESLSSLLLSALTYRKLSIESGIYL